MKTPDEVKKGLECCERHYVDLWENHCSGCSYISREGCTREMLDDAIELIRQLESRLVEANKTSDELKAKLAEYEKPLVPMALEEAKSMVGVWVEDDGCCWGDDEPHPVLYHARVNREWAAFMDRDFEKDGDEYRYFAEDEYGKTWRCWSRRPTDEERKAAKWDD